MTITTSDDIKTPNDNKMDEILHKLDRIIEILEEPAKKAAMEEHKKDQTAASCANALRNYAQSDDQSE